MWKEHNISYALTPRNFQYSEGKDKLIIMQTSKKKKKKKKKRGTSHIEWLVKHRNIGMEHGNSDGYWWCLVVVCVLQEC